jgi:hypothetical protein
MKRTGLVTACIAFSALLLAGIGCGPKTDQSDPVFTVIDMSWERTIVVEQRQTVEDYGWQGNLPANARVVSCERRLKQYVDCNPYYCNPYPYQYVCGTYVCGTYQWCDAWGCYWADQYCDQYCTETRYETCYETCEEYGEYCLYRAEKWTQVQAYSASGAESDVPVWPEVPAIRSDQREDRDQSYLIEFSGPSRVYELNTTSLSEYEKYEVGQSWAAEVDAAGNIRPLYRVTRSVPQGN